MYDYGSEHDDEGDGRLATEKRVYTFNDLDKEQIITGLEILIAEQSQHRTLAEYRDWLENGGSPYECFGDFEAAQKEIEDEQMEAEKEELAPRGTPFRESLEQVGDDFLAAWESMDAQRKDDPAFWQEYLQGRQSFVTTLSQEEYIEQSEVYLHDLFLEAAAACRREGDFLPANKLEDIATHLDSY